jgi:hypothetical protein
MKRKNTSLIIIVLTVIVTWSIHGQLTAQVAGDLRNVTLDIGKLESSDLALSPQVDDDGNVVVTGGVTVKEGDKVSFNYKATLVTDTAGFWIEATGKTYFCEFRDKNDLCIGYGKVKGDVRWDKTRKLTSGKDSFVEIKMRFEKNAVYHPVTKAEIKPNGLILKTHDGRSFRISKFSSDVSAVLEEQKKK